MERARRTVSSARLLECDRQSQCFESQIRDEGEADFVQRQRRRRRRQRRSRLFRTLVAIRERGSRRKITRRRCFGTRRSFSSFHKQLVPNSPPLLCDPKLSLSERRLDGWIIGGEVSVVEGSRRFPYANTISFQRRFASPTVREREQPSIVYTRSKSQSPRR